MVIHNTCTPDGQVSTYTVVNPTTGNQTTQYTYDNNQIIAQFDGAMGTTLGADNHSHRYLWGAAVCQLLADEQVTVPGTPGKVVWPLNSNRDLAVYDPVTHLTTIVNHRVYNGMD